MKSIALLFTKGQLPQGVFFAPEDNFMDEVELCAKTLLKSSDSEYGVLVIYGEENPRAYNVITDIDGAVLAIDLIPW